MQSYSEKPLKRRKDMSSYDVFILALKKMAAPKKLRPVQLLSSSSTFQVKRTWMIIAWLVSMIIIIVSAYLVMLYSLKYGEVQSLRWLSSLSMTMGQDIFIFTPIKIILLAVILSLAFERIFDAGYFQLKVKDALRLELYGNREFLKQLCERRAHKMYYPMSDKEKSVWREKQIRRLKWRSLIDFIVVLLFILVLCLVMSNMWSGSHFAPNNHAITLLQSHMDPDNFRLNRVVNRTDFTSFMETTFVTTLYTFRWYNSVEMPILTFKDDAYTRKDWASDFTSRLIGIPRLRQLRVKPECEVNELMKPMVPYCTLPWNGMNSDDEDYGIRWRQATFQDLQRYFTYWRFTEAWNSSVFALPGKTGTLYSASGYIADLGTNRGYTSKILQDLDTWNWLDSHTRVVFVEFTLYNVNNYLFTQITLIVEHLPNGVFLVAQNADSVHIREEISLWNTTYIIFNIILLIRILYKINRNGLLNFSSAFLNIYETVVIFIGVLSIIAYLIHLNESSYYVEEFQRKGTDTFFHFKEVIGYFFLTRVLLCVLFCLLIFRVFVNWHFGRSFVSFYFTAILSKRWIAILVLLFLGLFFIFWRMIGYMISTTIFSDYKSLLIHPRSYRVIHKPHSSTRAEIFLWILFALVLGLQVLCFVLFSYYYKLAKNHRIDPMDYFNYITFLFEEFKRKFRRNRKRKMKITVV
uniref:Polycystin domain-containing protein n=1 Tax=Cuerna arida TaxID=1464854 RepID=A0A1B6GVF8_9HEMI